MELLRTRKPLFGKRNTASPSEPALLTTPTECFPPEAKHPVPEQTESVQVPRYRVVVEITMHNRSEPFSGLRHWILSTARQDATRTI